MRWSLSQNEICFFTIAVRRMRIHIGRGLLVAFCVDLNICFTYETLALGVIHKLRNRGWGGGVSPKDYGIT